jgi:GTP-binding protein YchF
MKLAITGLSNSGKTTIFNALTGKNIQTSHYPAMEGEPHFGIVKVPDLRIEKLSEFFSRKKLVYPTVEYIDYIGINTKDASQNIKVFDLIKDSDAIVHVVRAFEDEYVQHPLGGIDPVRDIGNVEAEILFHDLEFIEKRLERINEAAKKGKKPDEAERRLMLKCREALEKDMPLRKVSFRDEELKAMRTFQFVSTKPEIIVLNIGERDVNSLKDAEMQKSALQYFTDKGMSEMVAVVSICGKIEMELAQMSSADARAFLDDMGIQEPALNKFIHLSYELLGLISFITIGDDEIKAWTITKGATALKAAGKVHSDIERGFIRAEVIRYDDFISCGNMAAARDKGFLRLEGKTYEVKDGDMIKFRFNV